MQVLRVRRLQRAMVRWAKLNAGKVNLCRYTIFGLLISHMFHVRRIMHLAWAMAKWHVCRTITGLQGRQGFTEMFERGRLSAECKHSLGRMEKEMSRLHLSEDKNLANSSGVWGAVQEIQVAFNCLTQHNSGSLFLTSSSFYSSDEQRASS